MSKRAIGSVFTAAAFMVGLSGPARAATEIQRVSFKGAQVFSTFMASANVTCEDQSEGFAFASGVLNGAEQVSATTGLPTFMSNGVVVSIQSYFNSCTGASLAFAEGGAPNALTPPDKKLMSAAMVGSAIVQDFGTGQTMPVSFNVSIVGSGDMNQGKSNSKSKVVGTKGGPISMSTSHFNNANRTGTASGTISIDGIALNPDFVFTIMITNDNTQRTVSKL